VEINLYEKKNARNISVENYKERRAWKDLAYMG
jgi:hypothetical protein